MDLRLVALLNFQGMWPSAVLPEATFFERLTNMVCRILFNKGFDKKVPHI
jgi:hypothetical protein